MYMYTCFTFKGIGKGLGVYLIKHTEVPPRETLACSLAEQLLAPDLPSNWK